MFEVSEKDMVHSAIDERDFVNTTLHLIFIAKNENEQIFCW